MHASLSICSSIDNMIILHNNIIMERRPLIAANWKMYAELPPGFDAKNSPYRSRSSAVDVVVFATAVDLARCIGEGIVTGAQCGHPKPSGSQTGYVSMARLSALGCRYVLCGHSERRTRYGETDAFVAEQAIAALELKMHPIVCIGETDEQRAQNEEKIVIERQMQGLPRGVTIAYEPVWAIGTGKTATPQQAQDMHAFIRSRLPKEDRNTTRIIYGGSMKAANAKNLLAQPDIDGGLIGGASLDPEEFGKIVEIAIQKT